MSSNVLLMNKARASHARGDFLAAARAYENILKLDRRNYDAAYLMAVALYQAGRLEPAAAGFAAAADINPRKVEAHKDRGLVLMKLGRYEPALASFEAATRLMPGSPELLLNRGLAQKNTGRIEQSVESYEAALRLKPGFAEAHNNLANSLSLLGRKEEALASYTRAFTLKPGYGEAYVNAAALLIELERPAEARAILEKAISANPRHAEAHSQLAGCLKLLGQPEEALAAASRAVEIDPSSADARLTRAGLFEVADRVEDALADYARALAIEPRNKEALLGKAELHRRRSQHEEAVALCDAAIAAYPEDPKAYHQIGRSLEARKELGAAAASYTKAAELDPQWHAPLLRRAGVLDDLGRHEEALADYDRAIALTPDAADAYMGRGDTLRNMRRFEEALACYHQAISLAPERPLPYGIRGSLRSEMGSVDEALEDFGHSLKIIAAGHKAAETVAEHCIKLLAVDKIPAIYASEAELTATRDRVEAVLDELVQAYEDHPPLGPEEIRVSEQAIRHLTGFYLAYHQQNDRETMRKLSLTATKLLSLPPYEAPARPARSGPIRVGVASQRLRNHNGANWAYNWFAHLPAGDYEIFTYNFETTKDALSGKFAALGTHRQLTWSRANPHEAVQQMRSDDLDILMLTDVGMTAVSRFLSLHRIAPCQFTAWGHPVTTGSPEMDFYLSSDLMEPGDAQDHYTEKLVRMPNLALYLDETEDAQASASAQSFGLPEGRVLYGCLQSLFKYLPRYDEILPRIALEVPEALFVFLEGKPSYMTTVMRARLDKAFAAHGLDAGRHVTFLERQKPADFDRLMQVMDVCIDSVGWSGGNTTLKNIAFGAPLATLPGNFMRGRHSSAMFRMIGAEEMIAASLDDYVAKLVLLGRQKAYRRHCRDLFMEGRHRLYRDGSFIRAFDDFLKARAVDVLTAQS
jgi:protein O-GlcNAc transferase